MTLDLKKLTPGVLDEYARRAFKYGACAALALAIHQQKGWPLVAITDAHNVYAGQAGGGSALHYAVRRPDGLLVDVDGTHTEADLISEYEGEADDGQAAAGTTTVADIEEWYVENQGEPIPVRLAASFVAAVVAL